MRRSDFHKLFKTPGPVVLPVIHSLDVEQTQRNVEIVIGEGAPGAFLINHDFPYRQFLPIVAAVRERWPSLWLGVNFLAVTGRDAFPVLGRLAREGVAIDAYWADDARIDERQDENMQAEAQEIAAARAASDWRGLYLGGVCFKKQREVAPAHYAASAHLALPFMDAVCTSGVATGQAADPTKIKTFRAALGDRALTVASGVTPENASVYADDVDGFLVATGINRAGDFYNIDPQRLRALLTFSRNRGAVHG